MLHSNRCHVRTNKWFDTEADTNVHSPKCTVPFYYCHVIDFWERAHVILEFLVLRGNLTSPHKIQFIFYNNNNKSKKKKRKKVGVFHNNNNKSVAVSFRTVKEINEGRWRDTSYWVLGLPAITHFERKRQHLFSFLFFYLASGFVTMIPAIVNRRFPSHRTAFFALSSCTPKNNYFFRKKKYKYFIISFIERRRLIYFLKIVL